MASNFGFVVTQRTIMSQISRYIVAKDETREREREINQGESVVVELTSHLKSSQNITTDNFFTSVPLAFKLLNREKNKLTLLGTLRLNRKYVPDFIKLHSKKQEEKCSSCFAFSDEIILVSYICTEKKSVIVLSSSKPNTEVMAPKKDEVDKKKPEVIYLQSHKSWC